ncbi:putative oxidoreductase [Lasiosphaeria hispida]|uniref:Oxidoreductase n=1 Tax=Lasiosphaeria hispida TaxID=260671 RepID=A0AAJ0MFN3_9PEZI|nr:putative oxidoreductase [Lasiosphaeria hispida]
MAPIRVGIIGLAGQAAAFAPGRWAAAAHLPPLQQSPNFEIVAIANSTIESSRKSISFHNLPPTTAAYGSAEDLAKDPNVDLIVVSVRVEKHFELTQAAIKHRKGVFVEWPLGASLEESEELTKLAKEAGVKTVVGLQARAGKLASAVKKILAEERIGKVISSHVLANASLLPVDAWWQGYESYMDMKSGGNGFYIFFGHFLDSFVNILGDFDALQATLSTQWPTVPLLDATGQVVDPAMPRTVPDHIMVQGKLQSGAVASISFRHTKSSVDRTSLKWIISGTEGEIEISLPEEFQSMEAQWQVASANLKLRVRLGREDKVEDVDFASELDDVAKELGPTAINTGLVYEAFANGNGEVYATFADALKTHRILDRIAKAAGL